MKKIIILFSLMVLVSCTAYKNVPYFQNSDTYESSAGFVLPDITIKPKDMLTIFVTSTDNEAVAQFNIRDPRSIDEERVASGQVRVSQGSAIHHYLVDNNGEVEYPVLGHIKLSGLTVEQAADLIKAKIAPYLNAQADFPANVNFRITA